MIVKDGVRVGGPIGRASRLCGSGYGVHGDVLGQRSQTVELVPQIVMSLVVGLLDLGKG